MAFNINQWQILQLGTRKQKFDYEMNGVKTESVQCVKDLGVTIASNIKFSQQHKYAAVKKPIEYWVLYTEIFPSRIKI